MTDFFHFLTIECFRFALVLTMLFLLVPGASCPAVVDLRELASRAKSKLPCLPDHYRPSQFTYLCMLGGAKLTVRGLAHVHVLNKLGFQLYRGHSQPQTDTR